MSKNNLLSLPAAILININIMLGAGLFVNSISLSKMLGIFSPLAYIIVGLIMLPLALSLSKLLMYYPEGSFFSFANAEINLTAGFFASWSYFITKMSSATLNIHFFTNIAQSLIPWLTQFNTFLIDIIILAIFIGLNMLNMRTGSKIQNMFIILKTTPICFIILSGIYLFSGATPAAFTTSWPLFMSMPLAIPLIIYAFAGFEASCSISKKIENSKVNGPKAILISYLTVMFISALFQLLFYTSTYGYLTPDTKYFEALPLIFQRLVLHAGPVLQYLPVILQLAIASSALGGSYGIIYTNNWNLYELASHKLTFFPALITKLNKHGIAFMCVLAEMVLSLGYLLVTHGNNLILPQLTALGCTLTYTICVLALYYLNKRQKLSLTLPILGLGCCTVMLVSCVRSLLITSFLPFCAFSLVLMLGGLMFLNRRKWAI